MERQKTEIQKQTHEEREQLKKEKLEIQKKAHQEIEHLKKEKLNIQKKANEEREEFIKDTPVILKKTDKEREQLIKEKHEIQKKADEEREQLIKEKLEIQKKAGEEREQLIKQKHEIQKKADEEREQLIKEKLEIQKKADEEREQLIKERDEALEAQQTFINRVDNRLSVGCEDMHSVDDEAMKPSKDDNYTKQPSPVPERTVEQNEHLESEESDLRPDALEEQQIANVSSIQELKKLNSSKPPPLKRQSFNGKIHPGQLPKERDEAQTLAEETPQNLLTGKEKINQLRNRLVNRLNVNDRTKKPRKDNNHPKQPSPVPERTVEQNDKVKSEESDLRQGALEEQQIANIPSIQELKKLNSSKPSPLVRQSFNGKIHPDAENLFRDGLKPVLYPTKVNGKKVYLTRREFKQKFPGKTAANPTGDTE